MTRVGNPEERTRKALLHMMEELKRERDALRKARLQWIETVDSVRDPLMVHDAEGRIVRVNRAYAERAGMTFRDLIGQPYWHCFPRRDGPLPVCVAQHFVPPNGAAGEEEVTLADGRTFLSRTFGVGDEPRAGGYGMHLFEDITDRRTAEARLRESEAKFRALVESTADWIWETDQRGAYTYCSPQVKALLGYAPEEMLGRTPFDLMLPEEAARVRDTYAALAAERRPISSLENVNVSRDGERVVLETSGIPILGADGELLGYRGIDRDITARKRAEEALERSERHFRKLIEGSGDAFYVIDRAGTVVYRSPSASRLSGFADADVLGTTITDRLLPGSVSRASAAMARALRHPAEAVSAELELAHRDGRRVDIEVVVKNHLADPDVRGVVVTARDITERKAVEATERARAARVVAHADMLARLVASEALAAGDVEQFARELTEAVARAAAVERSNVWLFNEDETELRCIAGYEATPARHSAGFALAQAQFANELRALKDAPYVNADDALTDPRTAGYVESYLKPLGITSLLDVLIEAGGKQLGVLCLEHVGRAHHWEEDEIACARQLADKVALTVLNRARRAANERLRDSEARFRSLTELSSDFYWETDVEHRLVMRGSGGKPSTVAAFHQGQQIGKRRWEVSYLTPDEAGWQRHRADLEAHRPFRDFELSRAGHDGSERFIVVSGDPIFDDGGAFKGYRGVGKDITERKRAELELRERLEELQRWNELNLDREERVLELKREVNALMQELDRTAPYPAAQ